jgi:predicted nucleic acid-binding protein
VVPGVEQCSPSGRETRPDRLRGLATRLDLIKELPISLDQEATVRAWHEILTMVRAQRLTTYDTTYLELALRRGPPLLNKDEELAHAAIRLGVVVLPAPKEKGGSHAKNMV